jgi:hypothetical protein
MKKPRAKKRKKTKKAAAKPRRRRAARVRPIVGPYQLELPLQMPLFPTTLADVNPAAPDAGSAASTPSPSD